MHKINIHISPLYIISAFFMVYFGAFDVFCYYLLALCFHEFGHYIVSKRLGYLINSLDILPYGAMLSGDINLKNKSHNFLVAVAGPLFNFVMVLFIIAIWWVHPNTYAYTHILVEANLYIGIFNLIPLFPFDGGQALLSIIKKSHRHVVYFIMKIISIVISLVYMSLFIASIFVIPNFTLLCMAIFMFVMSTESYNVAYTDGIKNIDFKMQKALEYKSYVVKCDINFINLIKYFSTNYYVDFKFVNDDYIVVGCMNQPEIMKAIENGKYFLK